MADIDIVPKRRTSAWLWIVLAIVVVAILAWVMMGQRNTARTGSQLEERGAHAVLATSIAPLRR